MSINVEEIYEQGKKAFRKENYEEAKEKFEMAIKMGHVHSMFMLGNMYEEMEQYDKAKEWYEKAGESGSKASYYFLGGLYWSEHFKCDNKYEEAAKYYEKAADMGLTIAQNILGFFYMEGYIGKKENGENNIEKAREMFESASSHGYAAAKINLGDGYLSGEFTEDGKPNYEKALKLFKEAEKLGDKCCLLEIAKILRYEMGRFKEAAEYCQKAIAIGEMESEAFAILAESDIELTKKDLLRILNSKNISLEDYRYIGYMYLEGEITKSEEIKKIRALTSEEVGIETLDKLDRIREIQHFFKSVTTPTKKDKSKPRKIKRTYKRSNLIDIVEMRGILDYLKNPKKIESNYKMAAKFFEKAAKLGDSNAMIQIADMYLKGIGVRVDYAEALKYYRLALEKGEERVRDFVNILENMGNKKVKVIYDVSELPIDKISEEYGAILISPKENSTRNSNTLYTIEDYKKCVEKINDILSNVEENKGSNEIEIFMNIYVKLGTMLKYDESLGPEKIEAEKLKGFTSRNLVGGLIEGKTLCSGYAEILRNVLACRGIECISINSPTHTFNQVKINGKWYWVDLTQDVSGTDNMKGDDIQVCLLSTEEFLRWSSHNIEPSQFWHSTPVHSFDEEKIKEIYEKMKRKVTLEANDNKSDSGSRLLNAVRSATGTVSIDDIAEVREEMEGNLDKKTDRAASKL